MEPVFRAVARTLVPEAETLDREGWLALDSIVARALAARPERLRRRLLLFLRLLEWLPILRYGHRFTRLNAERRARVLRDLQDHRVLLIRVGFWGLRTLVLMGYYGRPDAAEAIGYRANPAGWEAVG